MGNICFSAVSVVNHLMRWIKTDEVKFSTTFLCRLMEMCASQYPGILPPPPASRPDMLSIGETLLIAIEESRGHLISEDYQYYINTMINFKATKRYERCMGYIILSGSCKICIECV